MTGPNVQFIKADPCGNTTVIVITPLPRAEYATVSRRLMHDETLGAEQVGFVEKTAQGHRLQMMGGEFCGNASRAYAAWLLMGGAAYLTHGGALLKPLAEASTTIQVEVSGHQRLLTARVEDIGNPNGCFAEIEMPLPRFIRHGRDAALGAYSLVGFSGIIHGVLWEKPADAALMPRFRTLLKRLGCNDSCCGLMFVEKTKPLFIRPLVYVGAVDSLVWEKSCGSGSLAVLAALADQEQQSFTRLPIAQPGGVLQVSGTCTPIGIRDASLAGEVYFPLC